MRTAPVVS